jgi:hypothetical protein
MYLGSGVGAAILHRWNCQFIIVGSTSVAIKVYMLCLCIICDYSM